MLAVYGPGPSNRVSALQSTCSRCGSLLTIDLRERANTQCTNAIISSAPSAGTWTSLCIADSCIAAAAALERASLSPPRQL
jgi:hypothetical protein